MGEESEKSSEEKKKKRVRRNRAIVTTINFHGARALVGSRTSVLMMQQ